MAITDEEVRIKTPQIEWYMPNTMSAVDAAQDACLSARRSKTLEGKSNARHTNNSVEERHFGVESFLFDLSDQFHKVVDNDIMSAGQLVMNLPGSKVRNCLYYACYEFFTCSIDGIEVYDHISVLEP